MSSIRRKNSPIWSYFTVADANDKKAKCDLCGLLMSFRGTITNLKAHLERRHPTINIKLDAQPQVSCKNTINTYDGDNALGTRCIDDTDDQIVLDTSRNYNPLFSKPSSSKTQINSEIASSECQFESRISTCQIKTTTQASISSFLPKKINVKQKKKLDKLLLKLFTDDFQPFSIVDDSGFNQFVRALNPSYEIPSRKVISNNFLPAAYEECRTVIKDKLKNVTKICLTTDCWSSASNESYLALTAHYITDDFKMESVLLDCVLFEGSHTSVNLAIKIKEITDSFDVSDKVLLVITDNASNIVGAIKELKWKQFGCYAHTINLIVNNALAPIQSLIQKARNIVTYFRRSNLATAKLMKYQKDSGDKKPKKLIQDICTRWNSCYYMLARLTELQDAIKTSLALSEMSELNLNSDEWKICAELVEILKPFEAVTRKMSGEGFLTGSQIIVLTSGLLNVCSMLKKKPYNNSVIQIVSALSDGVSTRMKNIEFSKTAGICTFLDPRFKLYAFTSESAKTTLKKHVEELLCKNENQETQKNDGDSPPTKKNKTDELSVWSLFDSIVEKEPKRNTTSRAIVEVNRYIEESIIPREKDPLQWWENNHHLYPNLGNLVKNYFPMVATSVPCERIFSKTGLIINDRRTRLKPNKVKELVFFNYNSKFVYY